ncbi:putative transcriptional regulator of 2-aminoethylphosphonate degradation [compost metagenome]
MAGFAPATPLYRVRRIRQLDDRPVLYVEHYLMPELFPGLLAHDLTVSLTQIAREHYGLTRERVVFNMTPTALLGDAASRLHVTNGSPALHIARVNYDQQDRPMDCDLEFWRQDAVMVAVDASG